MRAKRRWKGHCPLCGRWTGNGRKGWMGCDRTEQKATGRTRRWQNHRQEDWA